MTLNNTRRTGAPGCKAIHSEFCGCPRQKSKKSEIHSEKTDRQYANRKRKGHERLKRQREARVER